jgi:TBC1 domain family member 14
MTALAALRHCDANLASKRTESDDTKPFFHHSIVYLYSSSPDEPSPVDSIHGPSLPPFTKPPSPLTRLYPAQTQTPPTPPPSPPALKRVLSPVYEIAVPEKVQIPQHKPAGRVRRLMATMTLSRLSATQAMPHQMDTIPSSPPDLTNSKSSKSSSFQSSNLSEIAGPTDISHFEDIALGDEAMGISITPKQEAYPSSSRRLLKQPSLSSIGSNGPSPRAPSASSFRELTHSQASVAHNVRGVFPMPAIDTRMNSLSYEHNSLNPPIRPLRRGFTNSSNTSLSNFDQRSSRSPSPIRRFPPYPASRSPSRSRRSSNSTLGVGHGTPIMGGPISRRQSWQSGGRRKSVRELEAEYDDKDDDLPEDAVVFNIPISPRLPHERSSSVSPQGGSPSNGNGFNKEAKHSSAPAAIPRRPSSRMSTKSDHSPILGTGLDRSDSYSSALSALDADARALTEAFEHAATVHEQEREERVQNGGNMRRQSQQERRMTSSKIELPPLQRPNLMMDPLPMSKEKEAVLSRTRPSHLPPKSKEEEERHLKQYQKMMVAAQEAGTYYTHPAREIFLFKGFWKKKNKGETLPIRN